MKCNQIHIFYNGPYTINSSSDSYEYSGLNSSFFIETSEEDLYGEDIYKDGKNIKEEKNEKLHDKVK